jgi:uncharacterized protein YbgA (DUF1722 family)
MNAYQRYIFVTEEATTDGQCKTNSEAMKFHYYNENGLMARKCKNDREIGRLVDDGLVLNGWHIAYGVFADYEAEQIIRLARMKRVGRIACSVAIKMMEEHCNNVEELISSVKKNSNFVL